MKKLLIYLSILFLSSYGLLAQENPIPIDSSQALLADSLYLQIQDETENVLQHLNSKTTHINCCSKNPYLDAYRRRIEEKESNENQNDLGF